MIILTPYTLKFNITKKKKPTVNKILGNVKNCLKYSFFKILFLKITTAQTINNISAKGSTLFFVKVPKRRNIKMKRE